jgi:hypothetical protein
MKIIKVIIMLFFSTSIYAQTIKEQQQIELQKKQATELKNKQMNDDATQLYNDRVSRVKEGGHTIICIRDGYGTNKTFEGFSFYKGELWSYTGFGQVGSDAWSIRYNLLWEMGGGKYSKKGDTVSWKGGIPLTVYEVNIKTNEYFLQRQYDKRIEGPKVCEVVKENLQNL